MPSKHGPVARSLLWVAQATQNPLEAWGLPLHEALGRPGQDFGLCKRDVGSPKGPWYESQTSEPRFDCLLAMPGHSVQLAQGISHRAVAYWKWVAAMDK